MLHVALTAFACLAIARNIHWSVGLFAAVALLSGILAGQMPLTTLPNASAAGIVLVLLFFAVLGDARIILELAFAVCALSAVFTLVAGKSGFVGNPSLNGCLMALTLLPALRHLALRDESEKNISIFLVFVLVVAAIFYSGEATPVMMLTAMTVAILVAWGYWKFIYVAALPLTIGFLFQRDQLFAPRGRLEQWRSVYQWWLDSKAWVFGNGTGSGQIFFPLFGASKPSPHPFHWAHNDFVGTLFENGLVGVVALLILIGFVLKRSFNRPWLFAACVGFVVLMVFNSPMHHALHAFFGASLVWLAFQKGRL